MLQVLFAVAVAAAAAAVVVVVVAAAVAAAVAVAFLLPTQRWKTSLLGGKGQYPPSFTQRR